ncbi:MAG: hypothetical protein JW839_23050 [Candidatus Lokiarchaeota archaeon]|nr:hypothetical protein [Candidatus Lokiarchaeota archaeon]
MIGLAQHRRPRDRRPQSVGHWLLCKAGGCLEQGGFLHPERLPEYYEEEVEKVGDRTKRLLAVLPKIKCPGCGCEQCTFEDDKSKAIVRDLLTGKPSYETLFTCKACGRNFSQQEGQGM